MGPKTWAKVQRTRDRAKDLGDEGDTKIGKDKKGKEKDRSRDDMWYVMKRMGQRTRRT